jgi:branched-chain amino acid transport system substrate-binding protein
VRELPSGTVTFLFTDMEGSTRLLGRLGREGYGRLLAEHHRVLRDAFETHHGLEVDTQGDAFFVVFRTAADAVAAAVAAQRALAEREWPDGAAPRIRMGLHTGEALLEGGRYVGVAVHRAQRVSSAAHGGQILLSNSTRELVADELPAAVVLRDLGQQQLKDLDRPERVFQLEAQGLPREFPPIRGAAPAPTGLRRWVPRTNLARGLAAAGAAVAVAAIVTAILLVRGGTEVAVLGSVDALAAIDPGSATLKERFAVGATPSAVAVGEGAVWVLSSDERTISRVDPESGERVPFGTSATPLDLAVGAGALWVGTGSPLPSAQTVGPVLTALLQLSPDSRAERRRTVLPREGGAISNWSEQHIAVAQDAVWTINPDFSISKIDPTTGSVVRTQRSFPADAIAASGNEVWAMQASGIVARLDPKTGTVTRRVKLQATALDGLAVGEGAAWVTADADGELWRIDSGGGRPSSIPVGEGAVAVAVGEGSVWVANALRGTVSEVSPSSNAVERTIAVGGTPRALAVGEGAVWVAVTASGGTVAAAGGDHQGLPGSFCDSVFFGGEGSPDFLIASDLALQGGGRLANVQMAQAIAYTLRSRGFKAGRYRIGYQSCDDSIARTGLFDLDKCAANARAYAAHEQVIGVVGTFNSPCALEEVPILNKASGGGLAMVSPTNSTIGLTRYGPGVPPGTLAHIYPTGKRNYVRVYPTDDYQGAALALLAKQLGVRRVAALYDGDRFFSLPLVDSFRAAAHALGVRATSVQPWNPNDRSYRSLAERIKRERPQAVFLAGILDANGGQVVRDLRAVLGPRVPLLGTDGFTPVSFLFERAGPAAKGMYVSLLGQVPQRLGARARRFSREFGATQRGVEVELQSLYAAQAAEVLLDAIARSDGTRRGVIEQLFKTRVERGILGSFSFDRNGDTTLNQVTILRAERPGGRSTVMSFDGAAIDRVLVPPPSLVGG